MTKFVLPVLLRAAVIAGICVLPLVGRVSASSMTPTAASTEDVFHVVGYLPEYRVMTVNPAALVGVTDIVFFSLAPTTDGGIDCSHLTPSIESRLFAIKQRTGARLTVAFGGGDRSDAFPAMATDPGKRRLFVMDLTQFLLKHGFDGVDYDWEVPNGDAQKQALTDLVLETKSALAPYGLTLSIATAPWDKFDPRVYAAVDRLHFMSYFDDSRHASLGTARSDTEALIDKGAPPGKICLGIPFYSVKLHGNDEGLTYADIATRFRPTSTQDEAGDYAFDGPDTIDKKCEFARDRGLGGVMIWELGQDTPDGDLVKTIASAVTK